MRHAEYCWRSVLQSVWRFHEPNARRYTDIGLNVALPGVALLSPCFVSAGCSGSGGQLRRVLDPCGRAIIDAIILRVVGAPGGLLFRGLGIAPMMRGLPPSGL